MLEIRVSDGAFTILLEIEDAFVSREHRPGRILEQIVLDGVF
jgi:hypothetical protein